MTLPREWKQLLTEYLNTPQARELYARVDAEYKKGGICPPKEKLFSAFHHCPPDKVSVVILGQDPYINHGQAMGMSFSINPKSNCTFPPSLSNIIKEVRAECGVCNVEDGDLTKWAEQGVLLLNTCLTVKQGQSLSHAGIGWEGFTRAVLAALNKGVVASSGTCAENLACTFSEQVPEKSDARIVFVLWGGHAKKYRDLITNPKHLVLTCAHPSPLSAHNGFFGCGHFLEINKFLTSIDKSPIKW